jgi:hypothetical protein
VVLGLKALDPEWPIREAIGCKRKCLALRGNKEVGREELLMG